jgi:CelD/BcsL family acetyltransferase involved in cellulose biosynthesis
MLITLELSDPRWHEFVQANASATPFHHPAWATLIARSYGYRAFALAQPDATGRPVAGLPVVEVRGPLGRRRWVSLPFTDHCPPLADAGTGDDLLGELDAARRQAGVAHLEVRDRVQGSDGSASPVAVMHRLGLGPDPEAIFGKVVRPSVRKWVRKAERDGVTVRRGDARSDLTEVFYRLHLQTRHRLGVPVQPRRYFDLLWDSMVEPGLGFVLLAFTGDVPIAGAVFLAWNGVVTYKYGASDSAYWSLHPNHLVMWRAIRWGCEHGFATFDFGRSDLHSKGLRQFKDSWGSEESSLVYTTVGGKAPRPSTGRLHSALGAVIRHSPPLACRLIGALLYRYAA